MVLMVWLMMGGDVDCDDRCQWCFVHHSSTCEDDVDVDDEDDDVVVDDVDVDDVDVDVVDGNDNHTACILIEVH